MPLPLNVTYGQSIHPLCHHLHVEKSEGFTNVANTPIKFEKDLADLGRHTGYCFVHCFGLPTAYSPTELALITELEPIGITESISFQSSA